MRGLLAAVIVGLAWSGLAAQEAGWQAELADEIALAESCKVEFLSQLVERTVNGQQVVMAKAHCRDKRVFDAWRNGAYAPFSFKECQTSAQTSAC
jgi:hypothetical protein